MDEPLLKGFLDFRLKANDLKDRDTKHCQYKTELEIIKNYHGENSEIGAKMQIAREGAERTGESDVS
ncbi:7418_t:CDS:2 [Funneliformis geosporum]|nr:7418_t:CDS:2 [Funneliformis geosporum]